MAWPRGSERLWARSANLHEAPYPRPYRPGNLRRYPGRLVQSLRTLRVAEIQTNRVSYFIQLFPKRAHAVPPSARLFATEPRGPHSTRGGAGSTRGNLPLNKLVVREFPLP